jgi:hypothetical protein
MLNCYCQLSSSVIFIQYGVSQSECKIDRPRPGLPRLSPRPHTEALGTRLRSALCSVNDLIKAGAFIKRLKGWGEESSIR